MDVMPPEIPGLAVQAARERPDLLAAPVAAALAEWECGDQVGVFEIDPELADTAALVEAYGLAVESSLNCVLIGGARAGEERIGACLVRADTRADVNRTVRRLLDVRKCSFLPTDRAVAESGMEYGGITPIGLPAGWRLLLDGRAPAVGTAIIGSGVRRSKLVLPGATLARLPRAEVVEGLGTSAA